MDEVREWIAEEMFDIWKEAKSTCSENWDDVTWRSLPENHRREYLKTSQRIIDRILNHPLTKDCPECGGTGVIEDYLSKVCVNCEYKAVDGGGKFMCCCLTGCPHADDMDCSTCNGTGKVTTTIGELEREWNCNQ